MAFFCFSLSRFVFRRLGPSQPGELAGGAKVRHHRLASRTLTASQGNAALAWCVVGGRAVRASARHPSWNSTVCGEPALTRDAGCRSASLVWTCAQLHYLTKRQQRNVDNETTYKTSAMKQPKRSGLAWSWQRRSSPQSGVVTLFAITVLSSTIARPLQPYAQYRSDDRGSAGRQACAEILTSCAGKTAVSARSNGMRVQPGHCRYTPRIARA